MPVGRLPLIAIAAFAAWVSTLCVGCTRCREQCYSPGVTGMHALPSVARGRIIGVVDRQALAAAGDESVVPEAEYRELSAHDCQCMAVEASMLGKLLDRESFSCDM